MSKASPAAASQTTSLDAALTAEILSGSSRPLWCEPGITLSAPLDASQSSRCSLTAIICVNNAAGGCT